MMNLSYGSLAPGEEVIFFSSFIVVCSDLF